MNQSSAGPAASDTSAAIAAVPNKPLSALARIHPVFGALGLGVLLLAVNLTVGIAAIGPHHSLPELLQVSDVATAMVGAVLFYFLLYYVRVWEQAVKRRLEVISEMNHHIRNALEVISLTAYINDREHMDQIKASVLRITRSLDEILPRM